MRRSGFERRALLAATVLLACAILTGCGRDVSGGAGRESALRAPEREATMFTLTSSAFENGGLIPVDYAGSGVTGGRNLSIPYDWIGTPEGVRSFALVVVDQHPVAHEWVHWMVTGIPADVSSLAEGASGRSMPKGSVEHENTGGRIGYGGPQPPAGTGNHEYKATLYGLDIESVDPDVRALSDFNEALDGHVIASASHSGLFGR
jgi:Raf kinase inhibitor-like YbhB/YbcL family protein